MRLAAHGVRVRYGARLAVDGVDLQACPGEVLAVLGANGSGKSSLLRALAGVQACDGSVIWEGGAGSGAAVGYMPQDNAAPVALTAFEVVLLGRLRSLAFRVGRSDLVAATAALDELGAASLASRSLGTLSGGQRQLVFLAQVLAAGSRALLLDEPTSALDIAHQLLVLDLLRTTTRRRGLTTMLVLHDLNAAARFADRVALMCRGVLLAVGTPAEVFRPDILGRAFDVHVAVEPASDGHPIVLPLRARTQIA